MKEGSDNFRSSAIQDIMERLCKVGIDIVVYEPSVDERFFGKYKVIKNLNNFKKMSDIVICNRVSIELNDIEYKTFTRDVFNDN